MSAEPFAGFNPRPSAWGYNWRAQEEAPAVAEKRQLTPPPAQSVTSPPCRQDPQLAHMPAALLGSLKRDKKPFTYTPGGVNLSEVLNARLQKRLERKQRYCEEKRQPPVMVVRPTYNTPLDMYSMENALEALEVQAELATKDKSLCSSPTRSATLPRNHTFRCPDYENDVESKGVTQSKAFRVLQIITDTEQEVGDIVRPHHHDEMRFTGIRDSRSIPSRFFQTLQKITGTEGEEVEGEDEQQQQQQHYHQDAPPLRQMQQSIASPPFVPQQRPLVDGFCPLKRPAAFLPAKTSPGTGFRPVRPPPFSNGVAGTDF